jgi:ABC-2 type transport system ATP-binding protein
LKDKTHTYPDKSIKGRSINTTMEEVIHIENLTKYYGKIRGIEDFTLTVNRGEIFGFLGPNGAGKTTTIRLCLGLISKTSGRIVIFGMDSHKDSVHIRKRVGYVPGDFGLIPNIRVKNFLTYLLSLSNCRSDRKMNELAARLDLDMNRKTSELSRGNRQKVGVVQAFMADQDLIILDEPTTGLDPLMQQEFYKIAEEEKEHGKTIFMSSHILAEAEAVCDRVAIIKEGTLKVVEEIASLQEKTGKVLEAEFRDAVQEEEFNLPGVSDIQLDDNRLVLTITDNLDSIIKAVANHRISNMNLKTYSLEQLFLRYYKEPEGGEE